MKTNETNLEQGIENILHDFDAANREIMVATEIKDYWKTVAKFKELIQSESRKAVEELENPRQLREFFLPRLKEFFAEDNLKDSDLEFICVLATEYLVSTKPQSNKLPKPSGRD